MGKSVLKTLLMTVTAGALLAACGEERDLQKKWESKVIDSEFNEYFTETFGDIDSDQDFHMVGRRTMNIANVGGDVNTTYTIYVCQGNPNYESDAMAIYQTTAQGQSAVSFTFDMPLGLDHVWVVRSAPNDQVASYVTVDASSADIALSMEADDTRGQVSESTINGVVGELFDFDQAKGDISSHTYTMSAPSTVLQNNTYYTKDIASGFEFKVESGTYQNVVLTNYCQSYLPEGDYDWSKTPACTLYVAGDVTIESCNFHFVDFYIPSGSTLTYNGADTQGVRFYVKEGGKLILNNASLNAQYKSWPSGIINEGEVVINGKSTTKKQEVTSSFSGSVTFPLNTSDYQTGNSSMEGFNSATVKCGSKIPFFGIKKISAGNNAAEGSYATFQPTEECKVSFADNGNQWWDQYRYDNVVELQVAMNDNYVFKPSSITGNVARFGTDGGNIDIYASPNDTWSPTALATGIIPSRNSNKYIEGETPSIDVTNETVSGQSVALYFYLYNLALDKQIGLSNIVISGTVTKTEWVEVLGDPSFKMANYCNFYNAGTMTVNCPLTFGSADGNTDYDYFVNYAGATLNAGAVTIGGKGGYFANAGTMTLTGDLDLRCGSGGGAQAINLGDLSAANLYLNTGVCHFYNGGTTLVSGLTKTTQNGNVWVNNGYYKTENLYSNAYNESFYNYCQLYVDEELYLHEATFNNMESSYVKAATMNLGNFTVNLYDNAVINVTSLLHIDDGKGAGVDNGFHGLGGEYAIVAANQMDVRASSSRNVQFLDKVYYGWKTFRYVDECNNTLTEAEANAIAADGDKIIFYADATARNVAYDGLAIGEPEAGDCGEVVWETGGGPEPVAYVYMLAYEDLGTKDDFDFNDIVLRVSHTGGTTTGKVELVAAGGTLKIAVAYDGETLFSHNDGIMYATAGAEGSNTIANFPGTRTADIVMSDDFTWTDNECLSKFTLNVKNSGGEFTKAISATTQAGYAPQCLVIPNGTWKWPTGRTSIKDAYPQFAGWVADKTTNTTWYNYPATGKVYTAQ